MRNSYLFTSESVSEGHPDKICDRISDTVVDLMLKKYPEARVACETMVSTNRTIIAGEYRLPDGIYIENQENKSESTHKKRLVIPKIVNGKRVSKAGRNVYMFI